MNFKINPIKAEILNIGVGKNEELALQRKFPFTWVKRELSYLGIKLTPTADKLYLANYIPLLNEIKAELKRGSLQSISWLGRINMFKMVILPKIIYKFQMLPIAIPQSFFRTIKTMIIKYIWQNKKPRLKFALITRKEKHGGLIPDINKYYKSVIISRTVEWVNEESG